VKPDKEHVMASKKLTYEALREEYATLWASMETRASKDGDIDATARKIISKKTRYTAVEDATGVPWYVVGVIHAMESGCNFATHLHNGDSLSKRTVLVPAGRPKAPPADGKMYSWKESACDALLMKSLDKITDWPVERICYELERYNGFGYRNYHADVLSPYLWSGSNHYSRGKYVADGKWSATAVSGQSGAVAILKRISELDPSVVPVLSTETAIVRPADIEEKVADPAEAFTRTPERVPVAKTLKGSRTISGTLATFAATIGAIFKDAIGVVMEAAGQIEIMAPVATVLTNLGVTTERVLYTVAIAGLAWVLFAKLDDTMKGRVVK
jgi:lysozyme family protein